MTDDIYDALNRARRLPYGFERTEMVSSVARAADTANDVRGAYVAREELVNSATFGGSPEQAFVAFAWQLARCDAEPEEFPDDDLLWRYKWIVDQLIAFPQFSRGQLEKAIDDMSKRYEKNGHRQHAVLQARYLMAREFGESDADWQAAYDRYRASPADDMSDCRACETHLEFLRYHWAGESEVALQRARPLLELEQRCAEVPHLTLPHAVIDASLLGRETDAEQWHHVGWNMTSTNPDFLESHALLIAYALRRHWLDEAEEKLRHVLPWTARCHVPQALMVLWATTAAFCGAKGDPNAITLPSGVGQREGETTETWCTRESQTWIERFDGRNGNDVVSGRLRRFRAWIAGGNEHPRL